MSPYPMYSVCWTKKETCNACGHVSSFEQTYSFFSPEKAIDHAAYVLNEGWTLLYIEL